jgi:hypothetical protein
MCRPIKQNTEFTADCDYNMHRWEALVRVKNPPEYIAQQITRCLFSVRNNAYDGIERIIAEGRFGHWCQYKFVPLLPYPILDFLFREG